MLGRLEAATQDGLNLAKANVDASKAISQQSANLERTAGSIFDAVKIAIANTSTKTALIVGFVSGFISGIPGGIIANAMYERNFSVDAMKKPDAVAGSSPPPPLPKTLPPQQMVISSVPASAASVVLQPAPPKPYLAASAPLPVVAASAAPAASRPQIVVPIRQASSPSR